MPEFELAALDVAVIVLYVAGILGLGFYVGRRKKDSEGYFLAGRGMIWPLVGFGLIAANFSGTQYLGLAGAGYEEGIAVWNYEWMAALVLVLFSMFVLPFYLQSKVSTVPEFFEKRYDRRSRYAFSGFTVVTGMLIDSAGAMFAGGLVLQLLFPEIPLTVHVIIIAVLGGVYVMLGGLQAVMITDTVQGILMFIAGGVIFVTVFAQFDFQWASLPDLAPEGGWTLTPPADDDFLPWPGIFTGVLWLGIYYWMTNHVVVQKVLSAKSLDHGRWGALFAGLMQLPLLVLLIFPGVLATGVFDDLPNADMAWPALVMEFMPVGVRGLVFAALIAALMSTLDSVLNGASSLVVNDFIKTRRRQFSERQLLAIGRVLVGVFMIIAAAWAPQILQFPTIVEYFQSFLGHVTMPVVVVLIGGLFWKRPTPAAGFWTLAIAAPVGFVAFLSSQVLELYELQFLYGTGIMLVLSAVLFVGLTLATRAPDPAQLEGLMWTRQTWELESKELADKPWWQNYRALAFGLAAITVASIIPFL